MDCRVIRRNSGGPIFSKSGFTLLELILALGILSLMTVTVAVSTDRALKSRDRIQNRVREMSQVRDALKLIQRDLELAYHARDYEQEMVHEFWKQKNKAANPNSPAAGAAPPTSGIFNPTGNPQDLSGNQASPFAPPPIGAVDPMTGAPLGPSGPPPNPNRRSPETDFLGRENELFFVTKNAPIFLETQAQADFIKVSYQLSSCRKPGSESASSNCLIRKTSSLVEGDVTDTKSAVILVEGVAKFQLRYFGSGKMDYVNQWSTKSSDPSLNSKFPESVEITLEIQAGTGDNKRNTSMQILAQVRFPNNREIKP